MAAAAAAAADAEDSSSVSGSGELDVPHDHGVRCVVHNFTDNDDDAESIVRSLLKPDLIVQHCQPSTTGRFQSIPHSLYIEPTAAVRSLRPSFRSQAYCGLAAPLSTSFKYFIYAYLCIHWRHIGALLLNLLMLLCCYRYGMGTFSAAFMCNALI